MAALRGTHSLYATLFQAAWSVQMTHKRVTVGMKLQTDPEDVPVRNIDWKNGRKASGWDSNTPGNWFGIENRTSKKHIKIQALICI